MVRVAVSFLEFPALLKNAVPHRVSPGSADDWTLPMDDYTIKSQEDQKEDSRAEKADAKKRPFSNSFSDDVIDDEVLLTEPYGQPKMLKNDEVVNEDIDDDDDASGVEDIEWTPEPPVSSSGIDAIRFQPFDGSTDELRKQAMEAEKSDLPFWFVAMVLSFVVGEINFS
jgi:hypothetical protein